MLGLDKSSWQRVRFGDVVRNLNETVRDVPNSGIENLIALEHLDPGELKITRYGSVADGTTFTRRVRPGHTLFGKRRAYQRKAAYAEVAAICSGDILVFEADEDRMSPRLLPFLVQSDPFFDHALGTSAGSLSPRTNWKALANFEFDLPPLDEQERIADLLWAVEEHRSSLQAIVKAATLTRSTWVDNSLQEDDTVAFSSLWANSPESGYSAQPTEAVTGRQVLSLAALGEAGYRRGHYKNVPESDRMAAATVMPGDLLISRANTVETVGRAGIVDENRPGLSFPDTMMRIRLKPDVDPGFVELVVNSGIGRSHMRRVAAGTNRSMAKINRATLGSLQIPNLEVSKREVIMREAKRASEAVEAADNENGALLAVRTSLLDQVFGGAS